MLASTNLGTPVSNWRPHLAFHQYMIQQKEKTLAEVASVSIFRLETGESRTPPEIDTLYF